MPPKLAGRAGSPLGLQLSKVIKNLSKVRKFNGVRT